MLAILLDLQGCVPDSEMVTQLATGLDEESIARTCMRHDQMNRERHLGRAHGPDVQVMHLGDARARRQEGRSRQQAQVCPGRRSMSSLRFHGAKPMCSTRRQR